MAALLPANESAALGAEGLTTTGANLIRRRPADGAAETVELGK